MISLRRRMRESRPDIPLHALAMLKNPREGIEPDQPGRGWPNQTDRSPAAEGYPLAYVGDVVEDRFFT